MNYTTDHYTYFDKHNNISKSVSRAPKQRIIHTHLVCENGHNSINYTAHKKARAKLSKNAFQLFDYLEFMPNDTVWALSSSNLYKESSLTEQTYKKAFEELLEKGYLVKKPITITNVPVIEDAFHFYEDLMLTNSQTQNSVCDYTSEAEHASICLLLLTTPTSPRTLKNYTDIYAQACAVNCGWKPSDYEQIASQVGYSSAYVTRIINTFRCVQRNVVTPQMCERNKSIIQAALQYYNMNAADLVVSKFAISDTRYINMWEAFYDHGKTIAEIASMFDVEFTTAQHVLDTFYKIYNNVPIHKNTYQGIIHAAEIWSSDTAVYT